MILKCIGGPMDGAVYHLDKNMPQTTRKPDGMWFNAQDEHGRWVQHQYKDTALGDVGEAGVAIHYTYDGPVVDTGIQMETREQLEGFDCSAGFAPKVSNAETVDGSALPNAGGTRSAIGAFNVLHVNPGTVAREIAARVWCDQEMRNVVMDLDAAEAIARIINDVRFAQAEKQSYDDLAASGGIVDAP